MILPFESNRQFLLGDDQALQRGSPQGSIVPTTGAPTGDLGGNAYRGAAPAASGSVSKGLEPVSPSAGQTTTTAQAPVVGGTGGTPTSYLDRLQGANQQRTQGAQQLRDTFYNQAGPGRSYGQVQGLLDTATTATATKDDQDRARSLVNAGYSGPAGLNQNDQAALRQAFQDIQGAASALNSGAGIASTLQQTIPGLTPGEALYDAQALRYDKDYQQRARDTANTASGQGYALNQSAAEAQKYAAERAAQESEIAQRSRGYLGQKREEVMGGIQGRVDQRNAANRGVQDQYQQILQQDTFDQLAPEYQQRLNTPYRERDIAGEAHRQRIMDQYGDISQYGTLQPVITSRGREWYGIEDPETGKVVDIRKMKGLDKATEKRLVERQRHLESLFGADRGRQANKEQAYYRDYAPLYFGEGYDPTEDFREFFSFQDGVDANLANTSTDVERKRLQNIDSLLGEANRLGESDPYKAAQIMLDADRALAAEEAKFKEVGRELSEAEKDYRAKVAKTRSRYKKSQSAKAFGKAARIMVGIGTLGLSEAARPLAEDLTGTSIDQQLGKTIPA